MKKQSVPKEAPPLSGSNGKAHTKDQKDEELFKVFSHPLRRRIFRLMLDTTNEISPKEIADLWEAPLSNVSYHVRVLADANAITGVRNRPVRGSMQHFYLVNPKVKALPWVHLIFEITPTTAG
jgi:DNA-binding transcriptional ArsR family regulator